jgi:hypothetical protein
MEYIDRNGGSIPLTIVFEKNDKSKITINDFVNKLWELNQLLENEPEVGNVISQSVILIEAKRLIPFLIAPFSGGVLSNIMENSSFLTKDNRRALFFLRMNEAGRTVARAKIVSKLENIIRNNGYTPVLTGGIYLLQGKLSLLVARSLFSGLILLITIFVIMGFFLSRSPQTTAAMFVSLCIIPLYILGMLGHLKIPLDIISAPAVNIGIAMGVDSIIHMIAFVRRFSISKMKLWENWDRACSWMWKPIICSMIVICAGFCIFSLSVFPPTQRFGFEVALGSLIAPLIALFVMPCLSSITIQKKS